MLNSKSDKSILGQDTFDEEKVKVWKATDSIVNPRPTSPSIRGHICRWWFSYKLLNNWLNPGRYSLLRQYNLLRQQDYGWSCWTMIFCLKHASISCQKNSLKFVDVTSRKISSCILCARSELLAICTFIIL